MSGFELPVEGPGYTVPEAWRRRRALYATEQLGGALLRAFALVERLHPGAVAPLGDLSRRGGGKAPGHASHRSGRDVDIFFYTVDGQGRPLPQGRAMLKFGRTGRAIAWSPALGERRPSGPVPEAYFDGVRTWALLRALFTDPAIQVQWVFMQRDLARAVLAQASRAGDAPDLLARAEALLRQPGDSAPHDDHMHVRVYCDPAQRTFGCADQGPVRWLKKHWKYLPAGTGPLVPEVPLASAAPLH